MSDHSPAELIFYETAEGKVRVEVHHEDETFWLSINQMAALFGVDKSGISRHLKNIFEGGELTKEAVVAKFATTADDGKTYQVDYYNLDAIISVGYRVNSSQATRFRIWATNTLREFIVKGFVLDDERLIQVPETPTFGTGTRPVPTNWEGGRPLSQATVSRFPFLQKLQASTPYRASMLSDRGLLPHPGNTRL